MYVLISNVAKQLHVSIPHRDLFHIFTFNPVGMLCFAIFKLFQLCRRRLHLFSVLGFRCVDGSRNPRSLSQQWPLNRSTEIVIFLIDNVSLSPTAGKPQRQGTSKQSLCCSSRLQLQLPSPNKFVDYSPAPALPARQTCRSDSAANVQRPCGCAHANCSYNARQRKRTRAGRWQQEPGSINQSTYRYMQI